MSFSMIFLEIKMLQTWQQHLKNSRDKLKHVILQLHIYKVGLFMELILTIYF